MIVYALFCATDTPLDLYKYTDTDLANSAHDKRSTSEYMFSFGIFVVTWSIKKQPIVALSSTKAEYQGAAVAT